MAESFARYTKGEAQIIIVGRSRTAGESVLTSFPKPSSSSSDVASKWKHEFVECDVSLIRNVHATTASLLARLPHVNCLVITAGYFSLAGRDDTSEGLDRKIVLSYYARWSFIKDLVPPLIEAREAGEDAGVMSVLAAGEGPKVGLNDLGLVNNYSATGAMNACATYNDLMVEEFASRYPSIAFTHSFPGLVNSPLFNFTHWAVRLFVPFIRLIVWFAAKSEAHAAEYQLYGLFSGKQGVYRRGEYGDEIRALAAYDGDKDAQKRVWEHTEEVVGKL
ncbi:hypothetical protein B0H10DRAFT_1950531 [Mycena sp. CBHHK59/15]|nr:hypothetical protein B0H10DRAFT_1950531 [Mycena sp. CBHHK59/15]